MEGASASSLATIISAITSMVTGFATWIGSMSSIVLENPVLTFFVLLPVIGIGIGGLRRLLNLRG